MSLGEARAASESAPPGWRYDGRCDVRRVRATGTFRCYGEIVKPFRAACGCGHVMEGMACNSCQHARQAGAAGCLTCWEQDGHRCVVRFGDTRPAVTAVAS